MSTKEHKKNPDAPNQGKNKKNTQMEQDKQFLAQKQKKRLQLSQLELIRFTLYYILTLFILEGQFKVETVFRVNSGIQDYMAKELIQLGDDKLSRSQVYEWVTKTAVQRFYNKKLFDPLEYDSEFSYLGPLRITYNRVEIDGQGNWIRPLVQKTDDFQKGDVTIKYNHDQNGYTLFLSPYIFNSEQAAELMQQLTEAGIIGKDIKELTVDFVLFNAFEIISYFQINFEMIPSGSVKAYIDMFSMRSNAYDSSNQVDVVRSRLQILWFVCFIYYFINEFIKVYTNITDVQKQYEQEKQAKAQEDQLLQSQSRKSKEASGTVENSQKVERSMNSELAAQAKETAQELKMRSKNMIKGLINHVSDVWNFINVAQLILFSVALRFYFVFLNDNSLLKLIENMDFELINTDDSQLNNADILQKKKSIEDLNWINFLFTDAKDNFNLYIALSCLGLLMMSFKMNRYVISLNDRLSDYLDVIVNVLDYVMFYLILLFSMLMAFTFMAYFIYGMKIRKFSTIYSSIVQLISLMMGSFSSKEEMMDYSSGGTFVFFVIFYFLISSILLNMMWVFVQQEVIQKDKQEELKQNTLQNRGGGGNVGADEQVHFVYKTIDLVVNIYINFLKQTNYQKYKEFKQERTERVHMFEKEMQSKSSDTDFDMDYQNMINIRVQLETNQTFILQEQRNIFIQKQKREITKLIWSTCGIILLFAFVSFFAYFQHSPYNNALLHQGVASNIQNVSYFDEIQNKYMQFNDILRKSQTYKWIEYALPTLFQDYKYKPKELIKQFQVDQETVNNYLNTNNKTDSYDFQLFSIETFDLVINKKVRLTTRLSQIVDKQTQFSSLMPQELATTFEATDLPHDDELQSDFESVTTKTVYPYSSGGFGRNGGFIFEVSPNLNLSILIRNLRTDQLLNRQVSTVTVDFLLVNPIIDRTYIYISIEINFDQTGFINQQSINSGMIRQNTLQTTKEIVLFFMLFIMFIILIWYTIDFIKTILNKNQCYNTWYDLFIKNNMTDAQLYYRQRQNPEIFRQFFFIIDVPAFLNLAVIIILLIIIVFQGNMIIRTLMIESSGQLFDLPLEQTIGKLQFSVKSDLNYSELLDLSNELISTMKSQAILSSLLITVFCFQILQKLSYNIHFLSLFQAIGFVLNNTPHIIQMLGGFITAFVFLAYFKIGSKYQQFSTILQCFITFIQYIYTVNNTYVYEKEGGEFEVFVILLPYLVLVWFIINNMIYAIAFRGYQKVREENQAANQLKSNVKNDFSFGFLEFIMLTQEIIVTPTDFLTQDQVYLQSVLLQVKTEEIFSQIKESIRQYDPSMDIKIWAEKSALDIQMEYDNRLLIKAVCDEITFEYMKQSNYGDFSYYDRLNQDLSRKVIEFQLRIQYWDYLRKSSIYFGKYIQYFEQKNSNIADSSKIKDSDEHDEQQERQENVKLYIMLLERELAKNLQDIQKYSISDNSLKIDTSISGYHKRVDSNKSNQSRDGSLDQRDFTSPPNQINSPNNSQTNKPYFSSISTISQINKK